MSEFVSQPWRAAGGHRGVCAFCSAPSREHRLGDAVWERRGLRYRKVKSRTLEQSCHEQRTKMSSGSGLVFCVLHPGSSAGHGSCSTSCCPLRYPRHGPASLTARHRSQRRVNVQQISPATLGPHQLTFAWSKVLMRRQPAAIPAPGCLEREAQPQEQQSRVSPVNAESEPFPTSLVEICFAKKCPFLGTHLRRVVCNCCVAASSPSVCALGLSVQAAVPEHRPTSWAGVTLVGLVSPW